MTTTARRAALTLLLFASGVSFASAQAPLPTAAQIHARWIEALGGRTALEAMTARTMWGRVELPAQGLGGPIAVWSAAPSRLRTETEITGFGGSTSGFDGETAWVINPATGPMILEGPALEQLRQQADFHGALHPERHVESAEVLAETTFAGNAAYQVKVRTKWGEEYMDYYDKATGLMLGNVRKQETPMGALEATTTLEEWRTFGGVKTPMVVRVRVMGMEQVIRADSISVAPIPDSMFTLPPEIKALKKPS